MNDPKAMKLYELVGGRFPSCSHTRGSPIFLLQSGAADTGAAGLPETIFVEGPIWVATFWKDATKVLAGRYDNLYVDISSTFFGVTLEEAADMVQAYGAERVLFGTDFHVAPQGGSGKIPGDAP